MTNTLTAGPAEVAHGINCVSLTLNGRHPGAAVLTPGEADDLADLLRRQAAHARRLTAETDSEENDMPNTNEHRDLVVDRNMLTGDVNLIDAPSIIDMPAQKVTPVDGVVTFRFSNATVRYEVYGQTGNVLHASRLADDTYRPEGLR